MLFLEHHVEQLPRSVHARPDGVAALEETLVYEVKE